MYKEGDYTPFKEKLENVTVNECWSELLKLSNFDGRRTEVDEFNKYAFCDLLCPPNRGEL